MAAQAIHLDYYAPRFRVEIGGETIAMDSVVSVEVDENLENPAMFTVEFNETLDPNTQLFRWLDSPMLTPGAEVRIFMGYTSSPAPNPEPIFCGKLATLLPGFQNSGVPALSVHGFDFSHGLYKRRSHFAGIDTRTSDAATEIARRNGLDTGGVEATRTVHASIRQSEEETDADFLKRLAGDIGFEVFVRGRTLYFRRPDDETTELLNFAWRKNLVSFTPRLSTSAQVSEVVVRGWNPTSKERIEGRAAASDLKTLSGGTSGAHQVEDAEGSAVTRTIEDRPIHSQEQADALARAELNRLNDGFITGSGEVVGTPELRMGMNIFIEGVGVRFSGRYYVKSTKHSLGDSGYRTTFEVRRNALGIS
jgi:phage protein D